MTWGRRVAPADRTHTGSSRCTARRRVVAAAVVLLLLPAPVPLPRAIAAPRPPPFGAWLEALIDEAEAAGFERALLDRTLTRLQPLRTVVDADTSQASDPGSLDETLRVRLSAEPIARGREMMRRHASLLARLEREYGVQGSVRGRHLGD